MLVNTVCENMLENDGNSMFFSSFVTDNIQMCWDADVVAGRCGQDGFEQTGLTAGIFG